MRFVTYVSTDGDRAGVINGDLIHALPKGTTLVELLGGRSLRQAGVRALAEPDEVVALADVALKAPLPRPPSIRDCLCFLDHMRGCLRAAGGTGTLEPTWYRIPAFYFGDLAAFRGWLKDGDVVSLRADGLGEIRQTVRAGSAPHPLAARPDPAATPRRPRINPAVSALPYTKGLHQVGDGIWAWLLPDGGYGRSNAGLVSGDGASLLVDTLYDLPLTAEMLSGMRPITDRHPLSHAVLTHSNGDHTHGGQLLPGPVRVLAAEGTAHEMRTEMAPELTTALQVMDFGPTLTPYLHDRFAAFDFSGIRLRAPDQTFDRQLTLDVGGREVQLRNLGPAHTEADTVVHVPDAGVLFAGDLLFIGCTPIVWNGPIANWIAACDTMIGLGTPTVVPGHGPVTDADGIRAVRDYFAHVVEQADAAYAKGLDFQEAAFGIDLAEYANWLDAERIVVNVYRRYREIHPDQPVVDRFALFGLMAEWDSRRSTGRE